MYQTRERVFHQVFKTPRSRFKKKTRRTLFRVFDMASQTTYSSWKNSKQILCLLRSGIQTIVTVVISFVFLI